MSCTHCGRPNPSGSLFCQDCGHRLGERSPTEVAGRSVTPPAGFARAAAPADAACARCGHVNPAHLRFCNHCGLQLSTPVAAPPPVDVRPTVVETPVVPSESASCWRCRSAADLGADFCKYCGARYTDGASTSTGGRGGAGQVLPHAPVPALHVPAPLVPPPAPVVAPAPAPAAAPANFSTQPAYAAPSAGRAVLVAILKDGSDGVTHVLRDEQTDIGRSEGQLILRDDPYLSPRHARLLLKGDQAIVRDLDSLNGVYVRVREPVELEDGDMILLGQQVLRFEMLPDFEQPLGPATHRGVLVFGTPEIARPARLVQYTTEGVGRDSFSLYRDETVIGREQGDVVCTDDPFMSRRHASITLERARRRFVLRDLGSSNGTAVRIRGERVLAAGDHFRVGRHLFRFDRPGPGAGGQHGT